MNDSPLRILVVLPMYGGSLPIGRYCASALRELGHGVRVFDASRLYPAYTGLKELDISPSRLQPLENGFLRFVSQAIWTQAQEQEPDIVLALAQAPLDRNLLQRMRQAGMRTVMWFVEDYRVFSYWKIFAPLYDAFAIIQKEPFLEELKKIGQSHAFYLPLAALPQFHKTVALTGKEKQEYGSDISFLGAGYPNRRLAFRPLASRNFKIWGSDWDGESLLKANIQRNGQRISEEESVKIYNASTINLNLHSSVHAEHIVSHGDFVNPRTFELGAMGAFQLVDKRSLMGELFADDELATFDSPKEFYEKIDYFLEQPEKRQAYAQRAKARVLKEHTYQQRMKTLVDYMIREFGLPGQTAGPRLQIPGDEALSGQLEKLAEKLGLSPRSSFEDVMARLRRQSGELDELETALLFLDEWRKLYTPH